MDSQAMSRLARLTSIRISSMIVRYPKRPAWQWLLDGALLMRIFDRSPDANSPQQLAAASRLDALTKRGRAEVAAYPATGETTAADGVKRLFRRPDEV